MTRAPCPRELVSLHLPSGMLHRYALSHPSPLLGLRACVTALLVPRRCVPHVLRPRKGAAYKHQQLLGRALRFAFALWEYTISPWYAPSLRSFASQSFTRTPCIRHFVPYALRPRKGGGVQASANVGTSLRFVPAFVDVCTPGDVKRALVLSDQGSRV